MMKRFYKDVTLGQENTSFQVFLDGRPIRTPAQNTLLLPSRQLAEAIRQEWKNQGEKIKPDSMPMMTLACSAIDLVPTQRKAIVDELLQFAQMDTLLYQVSSPETLAEKQARLWPPLVQWCEQRWDVTFSVAKDTLAITQSKRCLEQLRQTLEAQENFALSGLACAVRAASSLIVGLALLEGRVTAEQAFEAGELEILHNREVWGDDPDLEKRLAATRADFDAAARFFS
jgi:chaperone required for assembly of F1-ATPase